MLRALTIEEVSLVAGGMEEYADTESLDGGGGDDGWGGGDGGDGGWGGGDGGGSGGDIGGGDMGGWSLPPGATNDYPDGRDVLNTPTSSGSPPPNIAPGNPSLQGPWISVSPTVSVQPGIYGSPTNPSGGGVGVRIKF